MRWFESSYPSQRYQVLNLTPSRIKRVVVAGYLEKIYCYQKLAMLAFVGGFFRMNEFEDLLNSVSEVKPGDVVTAEVLTLDNDQANVVIEGTGVEGVN